MTRDLMLPGEGQVEKITVRWKKEMGGRAKESQRGWEREKWKKATGCHKHKDSSSLLSTCCAF